MKTIEIICSYCKKKPRKKVDCWPTWFGKYKGEIRIKTICSDCYPEKKKEWSKIK